MTSPYFRRRKRSRFFDGDDDADEPTGGVPAEGAACGCGAGTVALRSGRYGPFLGCTAYPKCRWTHRLAGGSPLERQRRRASGLRVRVEMETATTIRVWSADERANAALRAALRRVTLTRCDGDVAARHDWTAAARRDRATSVFRLVDHDDLLAQLQASGDGGGGGGGGAAESSASSERVAASTPLTVQSVPAATLAFFRGRSEAAAPCEPPPPSASSSRLPPSGEAHVAALCARIPERLFRRLLGFQLRGVAQLLEWGGRGLLADEMGLGKTVQALAVLAALRPWPVLLVVPASLRLMWAEELETWLTELLTPSDVHLIASSSDALQQVAAPACIAFWGCGGWSGGGNPP